MDTVYHVHYNVYGVFSFFLIVWGLKKLILHFGLINFAERHINSYWKILSSFAKDRQDALAPGPIRGLGRIVLKADSKVRFAQRILLTRIF